MSEVGDGESGLVTVVCAQRLLFNWTEVNDYSDIAGVFPSAIILMSHDQ